MKTIYKGNGFSGNKSVYTVKNFDELAHPSNKTLKGFLRFYEEYGRTVECCGKRIAFNGRSCDCYHPHYSKTRYYFHKSKLVAMVTWAREVYKESFYQEGFDPKLQKIKQEETRKEHELSQKKVKSQNIMNQAVCIGVELQQYGQKKKTRNDLSSITNVFLDMIETEY